MNKKSNAIIKYIGIAVILFILLFPVYWMINCSLLPSNIIMTVPPTVLPTSPTLKNCTQIFQNPLYLNFFKNSFTSIH